MNDGILDTTVVALTNTDLRARAHASSLNRRVTLLERCLNGSLRVRYNKILFDEYEEHIKEYRNDLIEIFFALLDSNKSVYVKRSTLSRQNYNRAYKCRWPSHDQHLIAAALNGVRPSIYVTEETLCQCHSRIHREFRISVVLV